MELGGKRQKSLNFILGSLKGLEYKELSLKPRKGAEVIRLYRWDQDIDIWYQAQVLDIV